MNTEKKDILYKKVKFYLRNRRKLVRFSLPTNLHRSPNLAESLHSLVHNGYKEYQPVESEVWLERYDQDIPLAMFTLYEANFWEFLYSNMWMDCSSTRVTEGQLLNRLLEALFSLEMNKNVLTYSTTGYEKVAWMQPLSCMKHSAGSEKRIEENVKITFTYYGTSAAGLQRALSHYGHVNAAESDMYTEFMSRLIARSASTSLKSGNTRSMPSSREEVSTGISRRTEKSPSSRSVSQHSYEKENYVSGSDPEHSQTSVTDACVFSGNSQNSPQIKISDPNNNEVASEDQGQSNLYPRKSSNTTKIIAAMRIPSSTRPHPSPPLQDSPVFIKSLGIFVTPPIDFLTRKVVHFQEEHSTGCDTSSLGSETSFNSASSAKSRNKVMASPSQNSSEGTTVETMLEEFRQEFEERRQNTKKRKAADILHEKACHRNGQRTDNMSIQEDRELLQRRGSSDTWEWFTKPVVGHNEKDEKASLKPNGKARCLKRTSNTKTDMIDPLKLNYRYSIDKLKVFQEIKEKEKNRQTQQMKESQRRSLEAALFRQQLNSLSDAPSSSAEDCDSVYSTYDFKTDDSMRDTQSLGNLSLFFDLCMDRSGSQLEEPIFEKRMPCDFKDRCHKAIDDFVVRKEQITCSKGYQTATTVTFNKVIPSRY